MQVCRILLEKLLELTETLQLLCCMLGLRGQNSLQPINQNPNQDKLSQVHGKTATEQVSLPHFLLHAPAGYLPAVLYSYLIQRQIICYSAFVTDCILQMDLSASCGIAPEHSTYPGTCCNSCSSHCGCRHAGYKSRQEVRDAKFWL